MKATLVPQSTGFALNAGEAVSVVDDKVVARVLSERNEDVVAGIVKREHDRQRRPVAYRLRMLQAPSVPEASAGPCPK